MQLAAALVASGDRPLDFVTLAQAAGGRRADGRLQGRDRLIGSALEVRDGSGFSPGQPAPRQPAPPCSSGGRER